VSPKAARQAAAIGKVERLEAGEAPQGSKLVRLAQLLRSSRWRPVRPWRPSITLHMICGLLGRRLGCRLLPREHQLRSGSIRQEQMLTISISRT